MKGLLLVAAAFVATSLLAVVVAPLLRRVTFSRAFLPEDLNSPQADVLRVGSAALITLSAGMDMDVARDTIRRCADMIVDGVAHLVVEFEGGERLSEAGVQLLVSLTDLERARGGHVCVVCTDEVAVQRLERARVADLVSIVGHQDRPAPPPQLVARPPQKRGHTRAGTKPKRLFPKPSRWP